jgi:hypothetical protein
MKAESFELHLLPIDDPMKTVYSILLTSLLALFLSSCTKESFDEKIVGKWQEQQVYAGYLNGGNFQWNTVPQQFQNVLEFLDNGSFIEIDQAGNPLPDTCGGTYKIINENQVEINSTCNNAPYTLSLYISKKELIITHKVIEGEIKQKFIKL